MSSRIPATRGHDYFIGKNNDQYYLTRQSATGRNHVIPIHRDDAVNICNQLIDLIEQDKHNGH